MSQKPMPLLVSSSITSPSKSPLQATDTPSGLGAYGVVSRPRFLSNQVNSPSAVSPAKTANPNKASFRYRPSRPSLGYIFDKGNQPPPPANDSNSGKKKKKNKKNKKKDKDALAKERMNSIRRDRKQSTLNDFSSTPQGQTFDAIKRELDFLMKEVPHFADKYKAALGSFHSTSHAKSRQVEFAFIQALSQWIIEDGAPAVKELTEFKEDVQHEITGLVSTCEELSKQNQQLSIVISDLQVQNDEIQKAYSDAQKQVTKMSNDIKDSEIVQETQAIKQSDIKDLSKELDESQQSNQQFKEKVSRLESYLKMQQKDNDDLSNKQFAMEHELQQSKAEAAKLHAKISALEQQHEHELMILAQAHEDYRNQMETEQTQLVQIAEEAQKQVQQLAAQVGSRPQNDVVTPMYDVDDNAYDANAVLNEDGGMSLADQFQQYVSEDEWLNDSDDEQDPPAPLPQLDVAILDNHSIVIDSVKPETPPPFDADFKYTKEMGGKSPLDPTKTFKMEKQKETLQLKDVTSDFSNERKSYGVDTHDVTDDFEMVKQSDDNVVEKKDVTMEFESTKASVTVETNDVTKSWRVEKSATEVKPIDPEASFVSEKHEHGVDQADPTRHFQTQSQTFDLERADLSNTFVMETKKEIRDEPKDNEPFVTEKKAIVNEAEDASLNLTFSKTDLSYTPKSSDADQRFQSTKMSIDQPTEPKKPQYAYQVRHLRMDVDAAPTRITKIRKPPPEPHDRPNFAKYYDGKDEIIRKSLAFQKIMGKWKKDEQEKGGKPQILVQREYELVNKWNRDEKHKTERKQKKPVNRGGSGLTTPASPSYDIFASVSTGQQKVTKARLHKLKPKLQGSIKIVRSYFVPKYQLKRELSFYFCLDGLPATTNLDKNESDKDRKNDFLVPALFFFDKKQDFDTLVREAGALAVRNAMFQKAFSRLAKGIITLHTHCCDASLEVAISKMETLKGRTIEMDCKTQDTKDFTGKSLYIVSEVDFHRLEFDTVEMRDEWKHKINKLVSKRTMSVQRASDTYKTSHKQSLGFGTPIQRASRASMKISTVKEVENEFD